ncbi:unnamed protein product [Rotaria magnacalcarata]|nr:unnamed protein product [Rotaria magnacalcarata]
MSLELPKFELYEQGSQIRRSSKTTKSAIVEGYGRRRYKADWLKFLIIALSSNDETIDHLETLFETNSLTNEATYTTIHAKLLTLGKMLNKFTITVEKEHISVK